MADIDDSRNTPSAETTDLHFSPGTSLVVSVLTTLIAGGAALSFVNIHWTLGLLLMLPTAFLYMGLAAMGLPTDDEPSWHVIASVLAFMMPIVVVLGVVAANSSQKTELRNTLNSACATLKEDPGTEMELNNFKGWAVRDQSNSEMWDLLYESCDYEPSAPSTGDNGGPDRSGWSDCDVRKHAVMRYDGFTDEEERELVDAINADCDDTPGSGRK